MDRLDELEIFLAIAEAGSLNKAARRLRRSAPGVTRALTALEQRVGVRLIERTTRRLTLTETGRDMLEHARAALEAYDGATHAAVAAPVRGSLRITAPLQFGRLYVTPIAMSFLDAYPQVQTELVFNDRNLDLIDDRLDVAFRIGALSDSSLIVRKVGEVRHIVVASPNYLRVRGTPEKPADLAAHDTIFGTVFSSGYEWRFGADRRVARVRLSPRLIVNDIEGVLVAARAGQGIARVLSYQVAADLAAGRLVGILPAFEPAPLPVQIVTASASYMSPKLRAFVDHAVEAMRKLPAIHDAAVS